MDITIGEFIQDHLEAIVSKCQESHDYVEKLTDLEYSKNTFGISFPFMAEVNSITENNRYRYWAKEYAIQNHTYKFCNHFGGNRSFNGETQSSFQGQKFLNFLEVNNIPLENKYVGRSINFIVVNSNVGIAEGEFDPILSSDNVQYWLIPCNPRNYDVISAFKEFDEIDWRNPSNNRIKIGDIVYIYVSDALKKIKFKTQVIKVEYGENELLQELNRFSLNESEPISNYFRIKLIRTFSDEESNNLSLKYLKENGLNGNIQGKMTLREGLLKYIKSIEEKNTSIHQLNTILFGPPGTGKTYNTINHALQIIEPNCSLNDRIELIKKFQNYVNSGQIFFTTFHQSYGYEEFIEGIKALPPKSKNNESDQVVYEVVPGIFKRICETAKTKIEIVGSNNQHEYDISDDAKVWKVSLGGAREQEVKTNSFMNSVIRIGWHKVRTVDKDDENFSKESKKTQTTLIYFEKEMDVGDFVVSLYDAKHIDAIGIVTGDYEWDNSYEHYPRKRSVQWLWTKKADEQPIHIADINKKDMVQQTVYRLWNIKPSYLIEKIKTKIDGSQSKIVVKNIDEDKKYIIIIDEINRGNISKIFGELITLIEPSKRLGADEALTVTLPYSGETFGVPSNVYIIGTMNTADRSIALMDTALRRRFEFIEMMPDYDVIEREVGSIELENDKSINISELLRVINERISYLYDRDHQIGHAYFMSLKGKEGAEAKAELDGIFRNKIIPLLQEYFYDDWEKIQIVLGDHDGQFNKRYNYLRGIDKDHRFIVSHALKEMDVLGFDHEPTEESKTSYRVNESFTQEAYLKITGQLSSDASGNADDDDLKK